MLAEAGRDGDAVGGWQELLNEQPRRKQRQKALGQGRLSERDDNLPMWPSSPETATQQHAKCGRT